MWDIIALLFLVIVVVGLAVLVHVIDEFRKLRRRTNQVADMLDDLLQIKYKAHDTQREMLRTFYSQKID